MAGIATMYKKSPLEAHKKLHDLLFEKISEQIDSTKQDDEERQKIIGEFIGIPLYLIYEMESSIHMHVLHPHIFSKVYAGMIIARFKSIVLQRNDVKKKLERTFQSYPFLQEKRVKLQALFEAVQKYLNVLLKEFRKIIVKSKNYEVNTKLIKDTLKELEEFIENIKSSLQ